jgi:NAD(P)-dependent dehydrogenase (short-subunit alcohol dehydrogenase family)
MSVDLSGCRAVVTGGGRGVGRAVAEGLAAVGAFVAVWARSRAEVDETARTIRANAGRATAHAVDVTDSAAVARAAEEVGPVDLLVANAGTLSALGEPWEVDEDDWWRDVETSLRGAFLCARAVLPGMLERGRGRIVNVSSNVAVRPSPYQSGYAAAKAGVLSWTEALAAAAGPHGIQVFSVSPGYVATELTRRMHEAALGRPWADRLASGEPLDPKLFVRLVLFLASGAGDALTGRYFHALDDVEALARRADEVLRDDLYVPRLRR